jgi:hypothetical protein
LETYKAKNGQSIFDIAIKTTGSLEGIFDLLIDNGIDNLESVELGGVSIEYEKTQAVSYFSEIGATTTVETFGTYRPREGQNIFDLALMLYGDIERVFTILSDNGLENIESSSLGGIDLIYERQNNAITRFFSSYNKAVNTGELAAEDEAQGIGEMIIESTFIIS